MEHHLSKLIDKIKSYDANCDSSLIIKAYELSKSAHDGQQRESGEPFIIHPIEVANIIAELQLDTTAIVAGILHDTIEDTTCTVQQIEANFGKEVALLVDGVTKLGKIPYTTKEEQQVENLRKMFLAMAKDIRVILIKLADRLHNMRTLKFMTKDKQFEKAKETLEIYAPLAHRLGISKMKSELEDLSLRYMDPDCYYDLVEKIAKKRKERESYINMIMSTLKEKTNEIGIVAKVDGRSKHFYSIYRKMKEQNKTIEQIYDLFAMRVIVNSVQDCYAILGLVHEIYKPLPGRFKDYIAMPKQNMYQSLHTTIVGPEGEPVEIQIRTWEMHRVSEVGIAAHWNYKEGTTETTKDDVNEKFSWLRQLLEWQKDMRDAKEFMETLRIDLYSDEVFVFTPKGDVISLPTDSTPIDFAYYIHSAIGNKMLGARVNSKIVPLDYKLNNGDIVEVITSSSIHGPSFDWLKIVKSSQAKGKINQWFKKQKREENIVKGKELVEKELKKLGLTHTQLLRQEWIDIILKKFNINSLEDLYSLIGYGAITANKIVSKLKEEYRKTIKNDVSEAQIIETITQNNNLKPKKYISNNGVLVKDIDNCLVRLSKCCNPLPGDDIIGYITRGRGVSVHRKDCRSITEIMKDEHRIIQVSWYLATNASYLAEISVSANDRSNLLMEVTNAINEAKISLKGINARTTKDHIALINLKIEIVNTEQLNNIIRKIKKLKGIIEVTRDRQKN